MSGNETKDTRTPREKLRDRGKRAFIEALCKRGVVVHACELSGVERPTAYRWRDEDEEFAEAWDEAIAVSNEIAVSELFRRAVEGYDHPVTYEGVITDHYKKFSDSLLRFLLERRVPAQFGKRQAIEHSGKIQVEEVDLSGLPMPV